MQERVKVFLSLKGHIQERQRKQGSICESYINFVGVQC